MSACVSGLKKSCSRAPRPPDRLRRTRNDLDRPTRSTAGREGMATLQMSPCGAPGNAKRPSGNVPEGREGLLNQCASGLGDGLRVQFAAHGERTVGNDNAKHQAHHVKGYYALGRSSRSSLLAKYAGYEPTHNWNLRHSAPVHFGWWQRRGDVDCCDRFAALSAAGGARLGLAARISQLLHAMLAASDDRQEASAVTEATEISKTTPFPRLKTSETRSRTNSLS